MKGWRPDRFTIALVEFMCEDFHNRHDPKSALEKFQVSLHREGFKNRDVQRIMEFVERVYRNAYGNWPLD